MQRYGKICTNTRKRTKKFTLSLFLARFFASTTVTTPLALGYHPEDARRVGDVWVFLPSKDVDISIVIYQIYLLLYTRFIYCFCIPLVYLWYSPSYQESHPPHSLQSPSILPQNKREHFCPRLNIILNS